MKKENMLMLIQRKGEGRLKEYIEIVQEAFMIIFNLKIYNHFLHIQIWW